MTLTLRAVSLNDVPLSQPITARFDKQGGTIGRADTSTMALPDPERHISRQQAVIRVDRTGYVIRNVGSQNPILVRNQTLAFGETALLNRGDRLRIAGYLLEVVDAGENDVDAAELTTMQRPGLFDLATTGSDGQGTLGSPLSSSNPFADLLGTPPAPAPAQAPAPKARPAAPPPARPVVATEAPAAWQSARLPDDFDPFALPPPPPPAAPRGATSEPLGVFDDLLPRNASASIDELFGLQPADGRDPLAGFVAEAPPVARAREDGEPTRPMSTDPLVLFGAPPPPAPVAQVSADRTPDLHAAFVPPTVGTRPSPAQVAAAAAAATATVSNARAARTPVAAPAPGATGTSNAAWEAFCDGAGIRIDAPPGGDVEALRSAGLLLRQAVEGTLRLLSLRSTTRSEMHADVTVILAKNNNPLKFSPDPQSAIEQLLQPPLRGFMPGPAAVAHAMNDLVGHSVGTMTGMRAALDGVLERFAPEQLETRLSGNGVLDTLVPMNRKAKLWELYLQRYERIRDEASDNFHVLFGKAFLEAYEQQVARLQNEQAAAATPERGA